MSTQQATFARFRPLLRRVLLVGMQWGGVLVAALLLTTLALLTTGVSPLEAYRLIVFGAFNSPIRLADMTMLAASLLLCASGLTLTFTVGLYNLGIEGQVIVGAIFAMIPLRLVPDLPPLLVWGLAFAAGMLGGGGWGLIIALLKHYGHVSEIFAGLGMNFLATGLALYLVLGPWKRPGIASMSGTERLPEKLWLPTLEGLRMAPAAPLLALAVLLLVWLALARTHWGLSLRAAGLNPLAAERLGVPATRHMVESLVVCGALAGMTGTVQVLAVFHSLIPNVSSGIGLMALLIVLLVRFRPAWVLPMVILFASFSVGSVGLPLRLNIDSSISGVLQGSLVLFALVAQGVRGRHSYERK